MTSRTRALLGICVAGLMVSTIGCGSSSSSSSTKDVKLSFQAMAGEHVVQCGETVPDLGTTTASAQLMDMRLYISDVKLIPQGGGTPVPLTLGANDTYNSTSDAGAVTMLDFENGTGMCKEDGDTGTNTAITGTVADGTYSGVEFTVGVPETLNHSDPTKATAPLNLTAMAWDWQAGRKFTKIELADPMEGGKATWKDKAYMIHLGSTGCTGNPAAGEDAMCAHPNRAKVVLSGYNPDTNTIAIDLARLVQSSDITMNHGGSPGCMSMPDDPDCQAIFDAFKIDWKADGTGTGQVVGDGSAQTVFTVM